jgi:predicted nucleic acid-binding protein
MPFRLHGVTDARVRRAAQIKAGFRVAYADAFAMALALELGQPLVTGDKEIQNIAADAGLTLEWLG